MALHPSILKSPYQVLDIALPSLARRFNREFKDLSKPEASKVIFDSFRVAIKGFTTQETGTSRTEGTIRLRTPTRSAPKLAGFCRHPPPSRVC